VIKPFLQPQVSHPVEKINPDNPSTAKPDRWRAININLTEPLKTVSVTNS